MTDIQDVDVGTMIRECLDDSICLMIPLEEFSSVKEFLLDNGFVVEYRNIDIEEEGNLVFCISKSGLRYKVSFFKFQGKFEGIENVRWFNLRVVNISEFVIPPDNIDESNNDIEEVLL